MTDVTAAGARPAEDVPYPSGRIAWYAVFILLIAYTNSFIDRTILALLVGPIQAELNINDTQMSLLHGLAFAIFYTALGVPIARLSDRHSRRWIIVIGTSFWSVMTTLCGFARSYAELFLARVGVGIGEASLSPAAFSMIADLFPKDRLGRALGIYSTGVFFGAGLAFLIGGWLVGTLEETESVALPIFGEMAPWRATFVLVGLPGILIGLSMLTVAEPVRRGVSGLSEKGRFKDTLAFIGRHRAAILYHFMGFSLLAVIFNGFIAWAPAFFVREFDFSRGEAGISLGWLILIFGPTGIVLGGILADWLSRKGRSDGTMIAGLVGGIGLIIPAALSTVAPNAALALVGFGAIFFFASFPYGAAAAALQIITPNRMRAQISALYLLSINLIGLGLGPTVIAVTSDFVLPGEQTLGLAMAITGGVVGVLGSLCLFLGLKPFRISAAQQEAG